MRRKKSCNKFIHIFMTVLILVNTLTSLTAFAESNDQPFLKLEKISKGKTDDQLDLQVMTRSGQENEKVQVSQPVIQQAVLEQEDQLIPLTVENKQSIIVPTQSTGSGVIHLTLKDTNDLSSVDISVQDQKLTYIFEQTSMSQTEESSEETTENSEAISEESTTEIDSSKQESERSEAQETLQSTETSTADTKEKTIKADGPTDIRDYFPNGNGTILTESKLVYLDENGDVVEPPVTANTTVRIFYSWSIPEDVRQQIEPGDYFDFKLPDELKPKQAQSGELKNSDGEVYAKYTIDVDGNIRFEFTDEVKNQSDINWKLLF